MRAAPVHRGTQANHSSNLTAPPGFGEGRAAAQLLTRGPGAPLPSTLIYCAGFLAGWWLNTLLPFTIDASGASLMQILLAASLLAVGAALFAWGMWTFSHEQTGIMPQKPASHVVMSGPYRWSRNPMYVGFTALYLGTALITNLAWPLLVLPGVLLLLFRAVIAREERYMRATFGQAYEEYCRRVPRWI